MRFLAEQTAASNERIKKFSPQKPPVIRRILASVVGDPGSAK
jgi:hypothetical protein